MFYFIQAYENSEQNAKFTFSKEIFRFAIKISWEGFICIYKIDKFIIRKMRGFLVDF
jgi:hypothetical protein